MEGDLSRLSKVSTPNEWVLHGKEVWLPLWMWNRLGSVAPDPMSAWTLFMHFRSEFPGYAKIPASRECVTRWFYGTLEGLCRSWNVAQRVYGTRPASYRVLREFDPQCSIVGNQLARMRVRQLITQEIKRRGSCSTDELFAWMEHAHPEFLIQVCGVKDQLRRLRLLLHNLVRSAALACDDGEDGSCWSVVDSQKALLWFYRWHDAFSRGNGNGVCHPVVQPSLATVILEILSEHPEGLVAHQIVELLRVLALPTGVVIQATPNASLISTQLGALRSDHLVGVYPPDKNGHSVQTDRISRWFHRDHIPCSELEYERRVGIAAEWVVQHLSGGRYPRGQTMPRVRDAYQRVAASSTLEWMVPAGSGFTLDDYLKQFIWRAVNLAYVHGRLQRTKLEPSGSYLYHLPNAH
ncbi:hypothetical protein HGA91_02665 [candidate division WWE3 bacterium]|nr:hypothetical protein [candidate division WWE3 bacterium]